MVSSLLQQPAETLLEYRLIDFSAKNFSTEEKASWCEENRPVEFFGEAPLPIVFELFKTVRSVATEVVYRRQLGKCAYIIYSRTDPAVTVHPFDVLNLVVWSEKELKALGMHWSLQEPVSTLTVNLSELWLSAQKVNKAEPETPFLKETYRLNPHAQSVLVTGTCPITLALYVFDWFLSHTDTVRYHA